MLQRLCDRCGDMMPTEIDIVLPFDLDLCGRCRASFDAWMASGKRAPRSPMDQQEHDMRMNRRCGACGEPVEYGKLTSAKYCDACTNTTFAARERMKKKRTGDNVLESRPEPRDVDDSPS